MADDLISEQNLSEIRGLMLEIFKAMDNLFASSRADWVEFEIIMDKLRVVNRLLGTNI
jgi:hypothetical protein